MTCGATQERDGQSERTDSGCIQHIGPARSHRTKDTDRVNEALSQERRRELANHLLPLRMPISLSSFSSSAFAEFVSFITVSIV